MNSSGKMVNKVYQRWLWHTAVMLLVLATPGCDKIFGPELEPPLTPRLDSQRGDRKIILRWTWGEVDLRVGPETHAQPKAFELYISDQSTSRLQRFQIVQNKNNAASSNEFTTVEGLKNGVPYYFAVQAIDEFGKHSEFSNTIMVMPAAAEKVERLFESQDYHRFSGASSPDGKSIAYVTTQFRNARSLHSVVIYALETGWSMHSKVENEALFPSWSPNGSQIAYSGNTESDQNHVFISDTAFKFTQQLTKEQRINWDPTWSPDGEWIAYISGGGSMSHQLFKISVEGGEPIQLTNDPGNKFHPDWSPDGARILFSKETWLDDGRYTRDLYVIPASGGVPMALEQSPWESNYPTWSPDGSKIAFMSIRSGHSEIWVLDIGTGNLRQVTGTSITHTGSPDWSPHDNRILLDTITPGYQDLFLLTLE